MSLYVSIENEWHIIPTPEWRLALRKCVSGVIILQDDELGHDDVSSLVDTSRINYINN